MKDFYILNESEYSDLAYKLLNEYSDKRIFGFSGDLGAGKTTFIKSICKLLGVQSIINSPTFTIVNEYSGKNNSLIYHFDCYRIKSISELIDIGIDEYLYSDNYCFIEWPNLICNIYPDIILVNIEIGNTYRKITF